MTIPSRSLNAETLHILCEDFGVEMVVELIDTFESSSFIQMEVLRVACAQGDWKRLEIEAHSLKSSAEALGADSVSRLAADLELSASQKLGSPQTVNSSIEDIARELALALAAQRTFLKAFS